MPFVFRFQYGGLRETAEAYRRAYDAAPKEVYALVDDILKRAGGMYREAARSYFLHDPPSSKTPPGKIAVRTATLINAVGYRVVRRLPGGGPARRIRTLEVGLFPRSTHPYGGGMKRFWQQATTLEEGRTITAHGPFLAYPSIWSGMPFRDLFGAQRMLLRDVGDEYTSHVKWKGDRGVLKLWPRGQSHRKNPPVATWYLRRVVTVEGRHFVANSARLAFEFFSTTGKQQIEDGVARVVARELTPR